MIKTEVLRLALCLPLVTACLCASAGAIPQTTQMPDSPQLPQQRTAQGVAPGPTRVAIPDVVVTDQNNRKVRFYSDLVKGKAVAVDFIFTTCTTICPPLTANFAKVQKTLLEQGKTDVHFISVSVDPEEDTPGKMKSYSELFHAQPGWTFVTGTRADLEPIWRAFSVYTGAKQDHPATVVIGNDASHRWIYVSGLTSAGKLVAALESVLEDKGAVTPDPGHGQKVKQAGGPQAADRDIKR